MKIKKHSESLLKGIKSIADMKTYAIPTFLSLDTDGNVMVDGSVVLGDCTGDKISLKAGGKVLYIYGENMVISYADKETVRIRGSIFRIELFEEK